MVRLEFDGADELIADMKKLWWLIIRKKRRTRCLKWRKALIKT